ncbi:MAG: aminotransferase class III-fold pyridoxal phosphate-dependent enzyme [SAR202 cluster bacterium]|nr:aspartate aminotransferase family protein [Chloroflexota bacterium]MQG39790.1 aminotransferase class III-fold pyridoxal phosphate-dependent enzyme [SAR202 cluster bacterium]|tara:strand:- start:840 stop:2165 length:1326 start_codon:yes stop_codon:yes gene_type:complete
MEEYGIYEKLTTKSHSMNIEAENYLPGGSSRAAAYFEPYPFFADRAEGHYIYDVDGNKFLDFMLNATTHILGHNNPLVADAVKKQIGKGLSYGVPAESQIKLSKMICDRVESVDKIRFTNSGTEATLNAIRLARAFTGRHKIAKIEGGYHGTHEYVSVSVSHDITSKQNGFLGAPEWPGQPPSVLQDVLVFPYNDISAVENLISKHGNELACIILEPVFSNIGYVPASQEFINKLREVTVKAGILLIFDEVQSFRLSHGGAQEKLGVKPDLTTFGKIIGGGMPVGAWGGSKDLMELYNPLNGPVIEHSGTFNANPMTMVAGEATLRQLTKEKYFELNQMGKRVRLELQAVFDELEIPARVTGIGSLFGMHFANHDVVDYRTMKLADQHMKKAMFKGMLDRGILLFGKCTGALSLATGEKEIEQLIDSATDVASTTLKTMVV